MVTNSLTHYFQRVHRINIININKYYYYYYYLIFHITCFIFISFALNRFPKNKESREKWLSFCVIDEKVLNTTTKLCSNHFLKDDIIYKAKGSIVKSNAVPCIIAKKRRLHIDNNVPLSGKHYSFYIFTWSDL